MLYIACVASVSNRVIARKLERGQKNSPSPVIPHFFCPRPNFLDELGRKRLPRRLCFIYPAYRLGRTFFQLLRLLPISLNISVHRSIGSLGLLKLNSRVFSGNGRSVVKKDKSVALGKKNSKKRAEINILSK